MKNELERIDIKNLIMGDIIIEFNSVGYKVRIQVYDPPVLDNNVWTVKCIASSNEFFEYRQIEGSEKQYLEDVEVTLVFEKH